MGLLVWVPFVNGNCNNQGLLNLTTSTLGTVAYESGKLGLAAKMGNGTQITNGIKIENTTLC